MPAARNNQVEIEVSMKIKVSLNKTSSWEIVENIDWGLKEMFGNGVITQDTPAEVEVWERTISRDGEVVVG